MQNSSCCRALQRSLPMQAAPVDSPVGKICCMQHSPVLQEDMLPCSARLLESIIARPKVGFCRRQQHPPCTGITDPNRASAQ